MGALNKTSCTFAFDVLLMANESAPERYIVKASSHNCGKDVSGSATVTSARIDVDGSSEVLESANRDDASRYVKYSAVSLPACLSVDRLSLREPEWSGVYDKPVNVNKSQYLGWYISGSDWTLIESYWYGHLFNPQAKSVPDDQDAICFYDNKQSQYSVKFSAATTGPSCSDSILVKRINDFNVNVKLTDFDGNSSRFITKWNMAKDLDKLIITKKPQENKCCVFVAAEDIKPEWDCSHNINLTSSDQYAGLVRAEELRHANQVCLKSRDGSGQEVSFAGPLSWSNGGISDRQCPSKASILRAIKKKYSGNERAGSCQSVIKTGNPDNDMAIACEKAMHYLKNSLEAVLLSYIYKMVSINSQDISRCWMEYSAKQHLNVSSETGAVHYQCGYKACYKLFGFPPKLPGTDTRLPPDPCELDTYNL